jgi:thioredoxin reductase (NADPH)
MQAALVKALAPGSFELEVVDVDTVPALEDRFGERVPVLMLGELEICHFFFDAKRLREVLGAIR